MKKTVCILKPACPVFPDPSVATNIFQKHQRECSLSLVVDLTARKRSGVRRFPLVAMVPNSHQMLSPDFFGDARRAPETDAVHLPRVPFHRCGEKFRAWRQHDTAQS